MKLSLRLPSFLLPAPARFQTDDEARKSHPYFTTCFLLTPILWPIGVVTGLLYLFDPKWRSAGKAMLTVGVISGMLATLVFLSLYRWH